ncbi:thioredoxin [Candidatus Acetothermia bacterium]|nr:thioredoxin [Candidatus Acetothermia bacterium]
MSKAIQIENNTFEKEVLQSALPTLVDFYADWCGPCKAIAPVINEIATELAGQLKVAKVNVDENEALSLQYGVQGIPTLILFQNGQEVQRITGFLPKAQLVRQLHPHLNATAAVKN